MAMHVSNFGAVASIVEHSCASLRCFWSFDFFLHGDDKQLQMSSQSFEEGMLIGVVSRKAPSSSFWLPKIDQTLEAASHHRQHNMELHLQLGHDVEITIRYLSSSKGVARSKRERANSIVAKVMAQLRQNIATPGRRFAQLA